MSIDLTLRHLRAVVAVADAESYTAAARHLHVAQSSLSRTVQEVEQRIGVVLFDRTTRRVRLTVEGQEFLGIAHRLVSEFDAAFNHFEGYLAGTRGMVTVAALPSLAASMLPPVLAAYRADHPDVQISVKDGFSEEVLDLVRRGDVDFAVTVAAAAPATLEARHIAIDRFSCVMPRSHRFAERDSDHGLPWAELADEPFVAFDRISSIRAYVDRVLASTRTQVGPVTEARNIGAVAGLVAAGLGVSAAPGLVLPMMDFADLTHRPLVDPEIERDICLIRDPHRPLSQAAGGLMKLLASAGEQRIALPTGVHWALPPTR